jgi:hypothetical protein
MHGMGPSSNPARGVSPPSAEKEGDSMKILRILLLAGIATLWTPLRADVVHDSFPFDVTIDASSCPQTGYLVIPAMIDTTTRTSVDDKGQVHFGMDFHARGTGSNANGTWTLIDNDTFSDIGVAGEVINVTEVFDLIGQGKAANIFIRVIAHVRILANGTIAVEFEHDQGLDAVGCTGNLPQ